MAREILSTDALLEVLNRELSRFDACNDCRFTSITRIRGTDEAGCNWSQANLRCSGQPTDVCQPAAAQVISQTKAKYNIKQ